MQPVTNATGKNDTYMPLQVSPVSAVPIYAVIMTTIVSMALALIVIGSPVAFNDLVSMSISGLYFSYMVVASLLLWRRCTGRISNNRSSDSGIVNTVGGKLVWGPFHIPGILGILINAFALIYMAIAVFFSFWPPTWAVTVQTANYSALGTMSVIALSVIYYFVSARHVYEGPIIEVVM